MEKIKMTTPLVEMDGDEMTRILWKMIKDNLLEPYIDLKTENDIQIKIPIEEYMTKENIEVWEEPGGTKKITIKNIEQVTVQ